MALTIKMCQAGAFTRRRRAETSSSCGTRSSGWAKSSCWTRSSCRRGHHVGRGHLALFAECSRGATARERRAQMWLAELQTLPECSCVCAEALKERRLATRALTSWRSSRHFEHDSCEARALKGRWLVETRVRRSHATIAAAQRARCRSRLVLLSATRSSC